MARETQRQKIERLDWALAEIARVTAIPADRRGDLDWLRAACSLAHVYAHAGRAPPPEPLPCPKSPPPPGGSASSAC